MQIESILEKSKDKEQIVKGNKYSYLVDYHKSKYTIVRIDGDHANILIRGNRSQAIKKLIEI